MAAKLTGWKIDILSNTRYQQLMEKERLSTVGVEQLPGLGPKLVEKLKSRGIESLFDLHSRKPEELNAIPGIGPKRVAAILAKLAEFARK